MPKVKKTEEPKPKTKKVSALDKAIAKHEEEKARVVGKKPTTPAKTVAKAEKKAKGAKTKSMPDGATPALYIYKDKPAEDSGIGKPNVYTIYKGERPKDGKGKKPITEMFTRRSVAVRWLAENHPDEIATQTWDGATGWPRGKHLVGRVKVTDA